MTVAVLAVSPASRAGLPRTSASSSCRSATSEPRAPLADKQRTLRPGKSASCAQPRRCITGARMTSAIDELDARLIATHGRRAADRADGGLAAARGRARDRAGAAGEARGARRRSPASARRSSPPAIGYPVLAFVFLEIAQGRLDEAVRWLRRDPRGAGGPRHQRPARPARAASRARHRAPAGDRSTGCSSTSAIRRSTSYIALSRQIAYRTGPLVAAAGAER